MSQAQSSQSQTHPRKRKKTQSTLPDPDAQQPAAKKSKHASDKKLHKKDKTARHGDHHHKSRHSRDNALNGEFQVVSSTLVVSIPPLYASNPRQGVQEMLDGMLMRYIPALKGVVISHSNLQFLDRTSTIKADCPFAICRIAFDATIWSPQVGSKLLGKVNLCSPDHISLLVHKVFNASIPRHHIPTDQWEFEHGPADNDPEFAPEVVASTNAEVAVPKDIEMDQGPDATNHTIGGDQPLADGNAESEETANRGGRWVHNITSERIGGTTGYLEFTVIGLTMANQMLSVVGSIQPDPFSPHHVPAPTISSPTKSQEDDEAEVLSELVIDHSNSSEDEEDAFAKLGKMADKAKETEMRIRKENEASVEKETSKKKKRKAKAEGSTHERKAEKKLKRKKP